MRHRLLVASVVLVLGVAPTAPAAADPGRIPLSGALVPAGLQEGQASDHARNVRIVLSVYEAFAAGDLDTINEIIHPDVVWIESDGIPYGGTFIGRDAVFEGVFAKIAAEWDFFTAEVEDVLFAGDVVVTLGRDSGTFKATGKSMVAPTASFWTLNPQGQVVRFVHYIDTLAVVGATVP